MNTSVFGECVQEYIRVSGFSQKELADEIGLHPKVLSRKLNKSGKAYLTHLEIHRIIINLSSLAGDFYSGRSNHASGIGTYGTKLL